LDWETEIETLVVVVEKKQAMNSIQTVLLKMMESENENEKERKETVKLLWVMM
jgi:hypothetical protein